MVDLGSFLSDDLTDFESSRISRWSKLVSDLPEWYNKNTSSMEVISRGFEAYLILLDDATKSNLIAQLQAVLGMVNPRKDRDAILFDAIVNEIDNADKKHSELATALAAMELLVKSLENTKFSTLIEKGQILEDIKIMSGEMVPYRDRSWHLKTYMNLMKNKVSLVDADQIKQITSWIAVISSYMGTI